MLDRNLKTYPLSPLQHGMLYHHLAGPNSGVDIEQVVCTLDELLDWRAFEQAWQIIVARHSILRTHFQWEDCQEPVQKVDSSLEIPFQIHDLSEIPSSEHLSKFEDIRRRDRIEGFDLAKGPLLRLRLFRADQSRYYFLWTFHHILLDGRSIRLVLEEVFTVYEGLIDKQCEVNLQETRPFSDYIHWIGTQSFTDSESFWRDTLEGFTSPTSIPLTRPLPPFHGKGGNATEMTMLSEDETTSLEHFARKHQITVSTLFQAAWALLLSRYSGEEDVVFGITRACRRSSLPEAGGMVGLFINSVPLRVQVESAQPLLSWLKSIRELNVQLREHEHTPLPLIRSWSEIVPGSQLFETLVVFENYFLDTALRSQGGKWLQREFQYFGQTNYPLTLIVYADRQLRMNLEYDPQRFGQENIKRMLGHMEMLLMEIVNNPEYTCMDIPMLSTDEEQSLLEMSRPTQQKDESNPSCLHELFEEQVSLNLNAIAVTYEQEHLTYVDLNSRANQLAHYLMTRGVTPGDLVALAMERSLEMAVAILGILKAGAAYVPIDPHNPHERIHFILEDVKAPFILTFGKTEIDVSGIQAQVIRLEGVQEHIVTCSQVNPCVPIGNTGLAYIIFTSGSTGNPKGVMVSHRNVTRLFQTTYEWFEFNDQDVWTLFHSYAFDFSVWEMWGAWLYGGRLVVVPYWVSRSPETFYDLLIQEHVTVLNQTPTAFTQLIQVDQGREKSQNESLRLVIFGGEKLNFNQLTPWMDRYDDVHPQLVNMYGITETTVHVTYCPIRARECRMDIGKSVIGRPLPDLQLYLLDPCRRLVPVGVPGEMYIGGGGVTRGYLNRLELTQDRFIPNPFQKDSGEILYKSGDIARRLTNGDIEYLGRSDRQVKIRGFRIELGEIEAVLTRVPCVQQAVVLNCENGTKEQRLLGYVVLKDEETAVLEDLREILKRKLPDHMVPSSLVVLKDIPMTANGKLDRIALSQLQGVRVSAQEESVAPHSSLQQDIAQVYSQLLGVPEIGIHDNFFDLGGNSILAIRVMARLRKSIGIDVSIISLFEYPTIAKLAKFVSANGPVKSIIESSDHRANRQQRASAHFKRLQNGKTL